MTEINALNIGKSFLTEIDRYLAENWQNIRCKYIYEIYSQFSRDLKEFKGNSNGFTGLSEYLIFRFLYHLLGGSFSQRKITPDLRAFVSNSNNNILIGQSLPVKIDSKKYYPDIVIYKSDKLMAVIQIKLYLTGGCEEVNREVKKLKTIKPRTRALLIIFGGVSEKGRIFQRLKEIKKEDNPWFDFCILKNNKDLLRKVLQTWIGF